MSAHLHLWIDLIFGSKQTGDEAEKALNKFYFLTYQDAIDTEALREMDPDKRKGIEAQIADYGQTPRKLFTRPHPPRRAAADIARPVFSGELSKLLRRWVRKSFQSSSKLWTACSLKLSANGIKGTQ